MEVKRAKESELAGVLRLAGRERLGERIDDAKVGEKERRKEGKRSEEMRLAGCTCALYKEQPLEARNNKELGKAPQRKPSVRSQQQTTQENVPAQNHATTNLRPL